MCARAQAKAGNAREDSLSEEQGGAKRRSMRPLLAAAATRVDARLARALRLLRLLGVTDPPEARKVSFLATPNMSTLRRPETHHVDLSN
jgi:hypothetical protein